MKWYVWNRHVWSDGSTSSWCDVPKTYRSKRAAHRALTDLTKVSEAAFASITPRSGIRIQYFAAPDGMVPRNDAVIRERN